MFFLIMSSEGRAEKVNLARLRDHKLVSILSFAITGGLLPPVPRRGRGGWDLGCMGPWMGGSLNAAVGVRAVCLETVKRDVDFLVGELVPLSETVISKARNFPVGSAARWRIQRGGRDQGQDREEVSHTRSWHI